MGKELSAFIGLLVLMFAVYNVGLYSAQQKIAIDLPSKCYTDLQPSNYFKFGAYTTAPFEESETGVKIFIEDDFEIVRTLESGSMRPALPSSSSRILVKVKPEDIHVGDILVMTRINNSDLEHRVIKIEDGTYTTKGDNNNIADSENWTIQDVRGKVVGVLY